MRFWITVRIFIPIEEGYLQYIYVIDKSADDGSIQKKKMYGVSYVPLTDAPTTSTTSTTTSSSSS